jgi:PAS domain-containing protein
MIRIRGLSQYLKKIVIFIPLSIAVVLLVSNIILDVIKLKSNIRIQIASYTERTKSNLETDVKSMVHVINFINNSMKNSPEKIKQIEVLKLLSGLASKEKGYFFVTDYDGNAKLGPATGKNVIDIQDKNGLFVVRELIKTAKAGGGFVTYAMPPIDESVNFEKVSYVMGINSWRWYIGAGVLLTDIEKINKELTSQMMRNTIIKVIALLFIAFVFVVIIEAINKRAYRDINNNIEALTNYLSLAATDNVKIPLEYFTIKEFKTIASFAFNMIEQRNENLEVLKQQEEKLRITEDFRKRIFESSPIPIVVMDAETYKYIDCNPAAVAAYRFNSKMEILDKRPADFSAPVQYDGTISETKADYYINEAKTAGSVVFEWKHQYMDGECLLKIISNRWLSR